MTGRALVTGAGKRLGRAMALYLGVRGFDVTVHYAQSESGAEATVSELRAMGRKAVALQADLLSEEGCAELLPLAAQALGGPITCLINNASIFEYDTLDSATRATWDRHMGSNLRAPFVLTQAMAAQDMLADTDPQGEPVAAGLIVNMLDQKLKRLDPHHMTYTLAKSALWTLTQTAAQALGPRIRVNAISPGPTLQGAAQTEEMFAQERRSTVLQRGAHPSDITAALGYLLEAQAVTGQMICVDGGQHLWRKSM